MAGQEREAERRIAAAKRDHATQLDLGELDLDFLPLSISSGLTQLTTLYLHGNKLVGLPGWLDGLGNLATLDLRGNRLKALPESLGGLTGLTTLYVHGNQLETLPDSIGGLTNLAILYLNNNLLTTLPRSMRGLARLATLDLHGNRLTTLPDWIGDLADLTTLDLDRNRLTGLPEGMRYPAALETLYLRGNGLAALPEHLDGLSGLRTLYLRDNQLHRLPESLGGLTRLHTLDLSENRLTALPDSFGELTGLVNLSLQNNELTGLPDSFGKLADLAVLSLYGNRLTELPESFGGLSRLRSLSLYGNKLTGLPDSFGELDSLGGAVLYDNKLTSLPDSMGRLARLTDLDLRANRLTALPESLGRLAGLVRLDLKDNSLLVLPVSLGDLPRLATLVLDGNPLISPPAEIRTAGTQPVLAFLRAMQQDTDAQWSSKMLVVGEAAVGKTSVTNALCGLPFDPNESQTHGVRVEALELPHPEAPRTTMRLNVWDFGGQLEYRATQRFYLTDRSLFLLVWNSRRGWRTGGQVEPWLQAITNAAPGSPIVIVATHCAQSVADLDETDLRRRYPRIVSILRVDCKEGIGIPELRRALRAQAATLPLMGLEWPRMWTAAAARLAGEPGRYISARRADALLAESGIGESVDREVLMAALHDRGEILHFARDPELSEAVILQPTWVDAMITRILDSQQIADRGGLLSRAHRAELWHDLDDPGLASMLTALMERFDLAYRIDSPDHEDVALVVERLRAGTPDTLPPDWDRILGLPGTKELRITFKLASRQAGVPSWFIAREHRFTTHTAWARGVLLRHRGGATDAWALLQDDDHPAQPTLRLTVRGAAPHTFYSLLTEAFTGILAERYPGLAYRQLVPCACAGPNGPGCAHEFDHAAALRAFDLEKELQCPETLEMVDPRHLLLGLRPYSEDVLLSRIESKVDDVVAASGRIERSQLSVLDAVRDLLRHRGEQGTHCPSVFTVTKIGHSKYELRLYCEQPDGPHPLPDNAGVYPLTHIPDWLRRYAPYLRVLLTSLRYALPAAGPVLSGLLGETLSAAEKSRLELSRILLDDLPALGADSLTGFADAVPQGSGADFAQLRRALIELDPGLEFGGLRERELPENRGIVYLCREHRAALRYPARPASSGD